MHTSGEALNEAVCNGVVCKRPGWNEDLRILREMADCKQSSLIDEDTCFGVALDKGANRQGRSLLIYLCFSYNREERKVDKLLLLFFRRYSNRLQASHIYDFK